jgi:CRP/FNR family transcriptional regulator
MLDNRRVLLENLRSRIRANAMAVGESREQSMATRRGELSEAPGLWRPTPTVSGGASSLPLTGEEKLALASLATEVQFEKGTLIYREKEKAGFLYILLDGVVKTWKTQPDGSNCAVAFCFPDDLFGWPDDDRYDGSAQVLLPTSAYKVPIPSLEVLLRGNADLAVDLLGKLRRRLRQQQRQVSLLGRNDALGRVAIFISMLEDMESKGSRPTRLYLPMSRSDIADFVGLSLEAVSRAFTALDTQGILTFRSKRHFQVADRAGLQALIDAPAEPVKRGPKVGKRAAASKTK